MSMHRRPLGRGRTMAAIGGGLMVVGCVLPWWQVGGTPGIPAESGNGLAGAGILVFLVGIATVALVALPYAAGDRPVGLDRWLSFALLAVAGWVGFAWRVVELALYGAFQFSDAGRGLRQRAGPVDRGARPGRAVAGGVHDDARARLPLTRLGGPRRTAATGRYGSARIIPPSTGTIAPVTYDAAGDSRNAPTRPSSSGSP